MLDFLVNNLGNIILVLCVIVGIIVGVRLGYIKQIKQVLLYLVLEAEKKYGAYYRDWETDRKSTRLNSSHSAKSRMPSSA